MKRKNVLSLILLCAISVTIFAGWAVVSNTGNSLQMELNRDGTSQKTLEITESDFVPGEERTYELKLVGSEGAYDFTLSFRQKESGTLQNYLYVTVKAGDVQQKKSLRELLAGETLRFRSDADVLVLTYSMPKEVGNEAQGAVASFDLTITAARGAGDEADA